MLAIRPVGTLDTVLSTPMEPELLDHTTWIAPVESLRIEVTRMDRPLVVQTEELGAEPAAWLAERCRLVVCPFEQRERFGELLKETKGLVIRTYTRVDEAMLAAAPKLRVVGRAGVGLDDSVAACSDRCVGFGRFV